MKITRVDSDKAIFFCCDQQEKFRHLTKGFGRIVIIAQMLANTSNILDIPMLVTEQNPKVLGPIVPELKCLFKENSQTFTKTTFSMINSETMEFLKKFPQRKQAVLFGIEAHVCVQQTCIDLLNMGYTVHLIADGVSSVRKFDRKRAFKGMSMQGAHITSCESLIFELLRDSQHPKFKDMLPIIKTDREKRQPKAKL